MSDVLFEGKFSLTEALAEFGKFATDVETRLKKINENVLKASGGNAQSRVEQLLGISQDSLNKAEKNLNAFKGRVQKAVEQGLIDPKQARSFTDALDTKFAALEKRIDRLNIKQEEEIKFTKGEIVSTRQLIAEIEKLTEKQNKAFGNATYAQDVKARQQAARDNKKTTDEEVAYRIAKAKEETQGVTDSLKEQGEAFQKLFTGLTVGGFALQRFGTFLQRTVSDPLKGVIHNLYETVIAVNDFEETLRVRGGKSKDQIEEIYKVVKRVSDLPNLERSDVLTIFTRLVEVTKGGITAQELEKIGQGLSKITTSLEAGEKRAFYGQLQDILGGGNVANIEKTLSLVPLLKNKYDELKNAGTIDPANQKLLVTAALQQLGDLPNVDNIATSVKRLRNEVFEFQRRIGNLYKEDLKVLVDFIVTRVIPFLNDLLERFEKSSKLVHLFGAAIIALGIVLPPVITAVGAFAIAIGGVGFAIETLNLSTLSFVGVGSKISTFLAGIPVLLNPIVLGVVALTALLTYLAVSNFGGFGDAVKGLANSLVNSLKTSIDAVADSLTALTKIYTGGKQGDVEKFLNGLLAVIGQLFGAIVELAALFQTILASAITTVSIALTFFANLFTDTLPLAFAKAQLAFHQMVKNMIDTAPLLKDIYNWIHGLFGGPSFDQLIEDDKRKIRELGGTITAESQKSTLAFDQAKERHKKWNKDIEESTKLIEKLSDALKEQRKNAVEAQISANQSISDYQSKKRISGYSDEVKNIRATAFARDLSNPAEYAKALEEIQRSNELNLKAAQLAQRNTSLSNLRDAFTENRDAIVTLAKDEADETVKQFYTTISLEYLKLQQDPSKSGGIEKFIDSELAKLIGQNVSSNKLDVLKQAFDFQKQRIATARRLSATIKDDLEAAQTDNNDQLKQLEDKQKEFEKRKAELLRQEPLYATLYGLQGSLAVSAESRKAITEDIDNIKDITKLNQDLQAAIIDEQQARRNVADAELQLLLNSDATNIEKIEQAAEIKRKRDQDVEKIQADGTLQLKKTLQNIIESGRDNSKHIRALLTTFGDELKGYIDVAIDVATHGVTPNIEKLNDAIKKYNNLIIETSRNLQQKATKNLIDNLEGLFKFSNTLPTSGADNVKPLEGFLNKVREMAKHPLTEAELNAIIAESEGLLNWLQNVVLGLKFDNPSDAAQSQIYIKQILEFIETTKAARKTLVDLKSADQTNEEIKLGNLEHQQKYNDLLRDQLELQQQLIKIRADRNAIPNAPVLSKIFDIISGNQRALEESQRRVIENAIKGAQLETDIAIQRAKIEEIILETKQREAGVSEEEIAKTKKFFEEEIEQIKAIGKLKREVLEEQEKDLDPTIGGGGILDSIFKVFRKKKKVATPGTSDKTTGTGTIDPDAINAGQLPPIIADADTDKTGANVNKTLGHLTRLQKGILKVTDIITGVGAAIIQMNDLSRKSIVNALAEELKALSKYAAIKALELAAKAVEYAVAGQWHKAALAATAAAKWGIVAVAAGVASSYLSESADTAAGNSSSNGSNSAGVSNGTYDPNQDPAVLRQKANSVLVQFDIRTDDGIIIKKNIKAINGNTELTTLTLNSQDGWYFPPSP